MVAQAILKTAPIHQGSDRIQGNATHDVFPHCQNAAWSNSGSWSAFVPQLSRPIERIRSSAKLHAVTTEFRRWPHLNKNLVELLISAVRKQNNFVLLGSQGKALGMARASTYELLNPR